MRCPRCSDSEDGPCARAHAMSARGWRCAHSNAQAPRLRSAAATGRPPHPPRVQIKAARVLLERVQQRRQVPAAVPRASRSCVPKLRAVPRQRARTATRLCAKNMPRRSSTCALAPVTRSMLTRAHAAAGSTLSRLDARAAGPQPPRTARSAPRDQLRVDGLAAKRGEQLVIVDAARAALHVPRRDHLVRGRRSLAGRRGDGGSHRRRRRCGVRQRCSRQRSSSAISGSHAALRCARNELGTREGPPREEDGGSGLLMLVEELLACPRVCALPCDDAEQEMTEVRAS
jgi:hypothetical protein